VAFLLRADGKLCFLVNNGQYVASQTYGSFVWLPLVSTLDQAQPLFLSGIDPRKLPATFKTSVTLSSDYFMAEFLGAFIGSDEDSPPPPVLTFTQVTPPLASVQAAGEGDGLDFAWIDLSGEVFKGLSFVKADFSHCNLTNATFADVDLRGALLTNADLTGATFTNCILDGAVLTNCTLTNTNFTGLTLSGTHFEGATFQGTILSSTTLAGAVFKQSDLTSVIANPPPQFYKTPLQPPSSTNPRTSLAGCRLNQSLLGNDWSMLDLTGATVLDLSSPLSSAAKPLIAKYAILKGLNNNNLVGLTLQNAVFDNAVLDGLSLNSSDQATSDLTSASFILASMHGTNLTSAILKGANMTGAQLGNLSQLFTLPGGYESNLNDGPSVDKAIQDQFDRQGITLSTTATLSPSPTGRVWQLNDVGNKIIYTIRLEDESGDAKVLTVYLPAIAAATLVNAYMPDAVLTGANLHGVVATGAQFYGAQALVDGFAILEDVECNDANLSNVNFTQANLYGANLSGAQLFNTKFIQAKMSQSASLTPANLSNANLQGADFTGATLDGAHLENAATAISVPTKVATQGAVYLFSLPYSRDKATLAQYTAELDAATTGFILPYNGDPNTLDDYQAALKRNNLDLFKLPFARQQPPIVLSGTAQIDIIEGDSVWQIVDKPQSYTLWVDPDETGANVLYVAPSLTNTQAGFQQRDTTLRWQTSAIADTPGQQWLLDNDSENPQNLSTGYVRFIVTLNGNLLDVYGTAVRIMRLGDKQQQVMDTETCNQTVLDVSNMSSQTTCPNGSTLGVNQQSGKTWDPLWLRARTPPEPPTCVPTDYQWCPPKQTTRSHTQPPSEP